MTNETTPQSRLGQRLQRAKQRHEQTQTIPPRPPSNQVPLSVTQERFWFLHKFEPGNPAHNRPLALRLSGVLNRDRLQQTLNEIIRRHEVLRATFPTVAGLPAQVIAPDLPLPLPFVDLSQYLPAAREDEVMRRVVAESQKPFDLAIGPLLRGSLFRLAETEHLLLLVMHHTLCDGWSARVFIKEMATLYESFTQGQPSPLPALPLQYADFAHWQRQQLESGAWAAQIAYWQDKLKDAPSNLDLPLAQTRPARQTYRGASQRLMLSPALVAALTTFSQQENVTLFMTLLAAFKVLLYRYTHQEDIVVGSPVAGRTHAELEPLLGFLINTLALRTDLSGDPTFRELLQRVRHTALAAYTHQDLPFDELLRRLNLKRDLSRSPLFQVMFNLENLAETAVKSTTLRIEEFEFDSGVAPYDLTVEISETPAGWQANFVYNTDLFDPATIARLVDHYRILLEGIVATPDTLISSLPLLTETERQQLLVEWNDTAAEYPVNVCLHQLFEAQVEQTPAAIAVQFGTTQLTYRQLNERANQLAHHLQSFGVGPETLVGLFIDRSPEMIVGLLAVLKAGGAYLPLSQRFPTERLDFILKDAEVSLLLTQSHLRPLLPENRANVISLDKWQPDESPTTNPVSNVSPANLAYVIYTSGSTGQPKGVLIEHRQIYNYVLGIRQHYHLPPQASYALLQPLAVDSSQTVIFPPLISGGTLHLISESQATNALALRDTFATQPVDVLKIAPSHLLALQAAVPDPKLLLPQGWLIVGGEASGRDWAATVAATVPGKFYNHYGPTETTVGALTYQVQPDQLDPRLATVPIGQPLPNITAYILDHSLQPVPIGVPGELYIGGAGVGRGYLNRPELTAERFMPDPFSKNPTARLYRTGDLARFHGEAAGSLAIEFLGRLDGQVKLRGHRLELGEIEAILNQQPLVRTCLVMLREDDPGQAYLVAYVVPQQAAGTGDKADNTQLNNDERSLITDLRRGLKTHLPDYMVPTAFVILEDLPRTAHGKIDRQALPVPDATRLERAETFVAPEGPVEEMLAQIWQEVLGVEQIGTHDNFFELGGHSLSAMRVVSRLFQAYDIDLPLRRLFEYPTIAELTPVIETLLLAETGCSSSLSPQRIKIAMTQSLLTPSGTTARVQVAQFSCFIIGGSRLPIQCAELLLKQGHTVMGLASDDVAVQKWAGENGIDYLSQAGSIETLTAFLKQQPFDYLFSISNPHLLPPEILALARRLAINYHNGPLPRYGGLHVTSWALINREEQHGVTWHVITERVDAGDILEQRTVEIAPAETAISLNSRCHQAGLDAFETLIGKLATGNLTTTPQDLSQRTYFSRTQRPAACGTIDWHNPAAESDALIRALSFGDYFNPLGLPKILIDQEFVVVKRAYLTQTRDDTSPGTIIDLTAEALTISTTSDNLVITELQTLNGQPLSLAEITARFKLNIGQQLPRLAPAFSEALTLYHSAISRHEGYWATKLVTLQLVSLGVPALASGEGSSQPPPESGGPRGVFTKERLSTALPLPEGLARWVSARGWAIEAFLLAAFAAYLARLSDTTPVDLGFMSAELQQAFTAKPFYNLFAPFVPLSLDLSEATTLDHLMTHLEAHKTLTTKHQTFPRDIIARYPELRSTAWGQSGLRWLVAVLMATAETVLADHPALLDSDVTLIIPADGVAPLTLHWVYDPHRVDPDAVATAQQQFLVFLKGLRDTPTARLAELPLLSATERDQLLYTWNKTDTPYSDTHCIHHLFEAQVERTPTAVAVRFGEAQLTYRDLNQRANQLAHYLQKRGVGPETVVGLCVERSVEMIIGLLGILKAGGAYLPLDPHYPTARLELMLADSQTPLLLTQNHLAATLPTAGVEVICLDQAWTIIAQESLLNPTSAVDPSHLAYIIYTSGSTGQPKGVMIEQRALVNFTEMSAIHYGLTAADRVLQFASISFDASAEEIYPTLIRGATLVLRTDEMLTSSETFWQRCAALELTVLDLPTAYWHQLVSDLPQLEQSFPASLRLVILGGEKVLAEAVKVWFEHTPPTVRLLNGYGPTEATVVTTICDIRDQLSTQNISIGRPIGNMQVYILDKQLQPVPVGVSGELHIGGVGVARGYLNRPDLTAEKFINNPFGPGWLYKSGDLARYRPDGHIEFLGRVDHQVKIRGFRIELGEIEAVLNQHPLVAHSVVVVREDTPGDKRLVAYLVPGQSDLPTGSTLRAFLKEKLPDYMLPVAFVTLANIPLTPAGKIDHRALPAPAALRPDLTETFVGPEGPVEEMLAEVWQETLKVVRVGRQDNFFELGGHSLLAVQITSRLWADYDLNLPLRYLFEFPTLAELALIIEELLLAEAEV